MKKNWPNWLFLSDWKLVSKLRTSQKRAFFLSNIRFLSRTSILPVDYKIYKITKKPFLITCHIHPNFFYPKNTLKRIPPFLQSKMFIALINSVQFPEFTLPLAFLPKNTSFLNSFVSNCKIKTLRIFFL